MELRQLPVWVVSVAAGFAGGTTGLAATAGGEPQAQAYQVPMPEKEPG